MKIDLRKIISLVDLSQDIENVCNNLEREHELFIFKDNKPEYMIMTMENYKRLVEKTITQEKESEDYDVEIIETLLNKIGKKIFVDYYFVFKEDVNPEEKLPEDFTLNSKRSRSSSARQIFKNNLQKEALKNIIQSSRLDEETLERANEILGGEEKDGVPAINLEHSNETTSDVEIKIGRMARVLITKFLQNGVLSDEEIKLMQEEDYSKKTFNLNYAVLKEVDKNIDFEKQKQDYNGYNRYYNIKIYDGLKEYILCSQWVENLHRSSLERWIKSILMKILIEDVKKLECGIEFIIPDLLNEYWPYISYGSRKSLGRIFVEKVRDNTITNVIESTDYKRNNSQIYKKIE